MKREFAGWNDWRKILSELMPSEEDTINNEYWERRRPSN
jgi:hypothetical protein